MGFMLAIIFYENFKANFKAFLDYSKIPLYIRCVDYDFLNANREMHSESHTNVTVRTVPL